MMITVKRISGYGEFAKAVGDGTIEKHAVCEVNWPDRFPGKPDVRFAIAHDGKEIFLTFSVREQYTMGMVTENNGPVWTDSCVEFFIAFDGQGYYNFEFNCIGTALLGFRKEKPAVEHAHEGILSKIIRAPSSGRSPFGERAQGQEWDIAVRIPACSFFRHGINGLSGMETKANFYKCGDNLSEPHYLSWSPIDTPDPDFHVEEFFGTLKFE